MDGTIRDPDEVRALAAAAATSASQAWRVVAGAATVPAMQRAASFAHRCQEHAVAAVTWAATAREYAGDEVRGPVKIAAAHRGAKREADHAEAMLRAAEEAAGSPGGGKGRPPRHRG
ncbi:MAG: hypothetical protein L6R43_13030 [Planctomycetes bacterium]|nr:hypothetical protein [Planctomycetota bacterium]